MENSASRGSSAKATTFVQTDINTFRELVQRLTGSFEIGEGSLPPKLAGAKRPTPKLHERRQCMRPKLEIIKPNFQFKSAQLLPKSGFQITEPVFTPTTSGFPTSPAVLSAVTPGYITNPLHTPSGNFLNLSILDERLESRLNCEEEEEERAIRERRFYLHPSPRSRPNVVEPELLPLFPLISPKQEES